jgi:glycyl-tRNA synthetase beta chain
MNRHDFLVEIGAEEMPPKSLVSLGEAFRDGIVAGLDGAGLSHGAAQAFFTPRRLAVSVRKLLDCQPERRVERRGPPVSAAFDAAGKPTRAATAFADSCGVKVEELTRISDNKGEFLFCRTTRAGEQAAKLLPGIVKTALEGLPIARRMRWGDGEAQFVRPVHWVVMLHGDAVVPGEVLGIPAGRMTRGHRFHTRKPIALRSPGVYLAALEKGYVRADHEARRSHIQAAVVAAAEREGGTAIIDPAVLEEVAALTEWPVPLAGGFEPRFLELPPEVLIATLQGHQRYFPLRGPDGALMPRFIAVANLESHDPAQVQAGNERVVRPRLADAAFFYAADRKTRLADRREALQAVTFQAQLGTLADKTARVTALAGQIARVAGFDPAAAQRAAELAKCDLLTAMVGEFPELQGVMGRYYARHDGEPEEVAAALAEQYLPRFAGDVLPATGAGLALATADKLDTVVGIFAIGQKPTGTKDPYGLRRAALGVLRILIETGIALDLRELIRSAHESVTADVTRLSTKGTSTLEKGTLTFSGAEKVSVPFSPDEIYGYMMERLRAWYLEAGGGVTTEMFDAVLDTRPASPLDFDQRLRALAGFLRLPDAAGLTAANKRIANILRKAGEQPSPRVDPGLLTDPSERQLAGEIESLRQDVERLVTARSYEEALARLASLRPTLDSFFDQVLVMADDLRVRANRLALLTALQRLFLHIANLSRLPG